MPLTSRILIRCSLIYLLMAMLLGTVILIHKAWPLHPAVWQLLPLHIEMAIFGWIIQFTLGTAYWMLPRLIKGPQRGPRRMAFVMVVALNLGILLNLAGALTFYSQLFGFLGRFLELLSVLLFIGLHWKRITTYRSS